MLIFVNLASACHRKRARLVNLDKWNFLEIPSQKSPRSAECSSSNFDRLDVKKISLRHLISFLSPRVQFWPLDSIICAIVSSFDVHVKLDCEYVSDLHTCTCMYVICTTFKQIYMYVSTQSYIEMAF